MALLKHRTLEISDFSDVSQAERFIDLLANEQGVAKVKFDANHCKLDFTYDLEQTNFDKIEQSLVKAGFHLPSTLRAKIKRSWLHYTEENELDNLHAPEQACCSNPDEILEKTKRH